MVSSVYSDVLIIENMADLSKNFGSFQYNQILRVICFKSVNYSQKKTQNKTKARRTRQTLIIVILVLASDMMRINITK